MSDITGKNVITVLVSKPPEGETLTKKTFYDPYTRNITLQYQGTVQAIYPSYDPLEVPQFIVKPQRSTQEQNVHYSFRVTSQLNLSVDFYLQDQYFADDVVNTYFCYNCQAPNLYFGHNRVVHFNTKADVKKNEVYECINPMCKQSQTYLGMVKILEANHDIISLNVNN